MREVYVLMRDVGEYADRDTSPVLATADKTAAEAALARAKAHQWPALDDLHNYDSPPPMPTWETADAIGLVRMYGLPTYRLETVRAMRTDIPREHVADLHAAVVKRLEQLKSRCDMTQPDDMASTCAAQRWSELSEVAEALRLLLAEEVRDGE